MLDETQVGVTPAGVELPRSMMDKDLQEKIKNMPEEFRPTVPTQADPKWRYMWRIGPRPQFTKFKVHFFFCYVHFMILIALLS